MDNKGWWEVYWKSQDPKGEPKKKEEFDVLNLEGDLILFTSSKGTL